MDRKNDLKQIKCFLGTGLIFFVITMPFRQLMHVIAITEIRPASALPPVFGLLYGWTGALGCAVSNLIADILSGYSAALCAEGFVIQVIFGILPYLIWKRLDKQRELKTAKQLLRYNFLIILDSLITACLIGLSLQLAGISSWFSTATLFIFLNNYVFCIILGQPIIVIKTSLLSKNKEYITMHEQFMLIFLLLGILSASIIGIFAYTEVHQKTADLVNLWNRVYLYISGDIFLFTSAAVFCMFAVEKYISRPMEGLASIARGYVKDGLMEENTEKIIESCKIYEKSYGEAGNLAIAYSTMLRDMEQYIQNLTKITAEKERIGVELDIATRIQASMLPCIFPAFPERQEFDIYATMTPAREVGGDFYDFFMVDQDHLAMVIADVSGKGIPAALFMVIGKTLIKDHTVPEKDLGEVFSEVNRILCDSNSEDLFITAFEAVLNLKTGELRYVNAGHEIPFICKKDGVFEPYKVRAAFVLAGMEGVRYTSGSMQLEPGDKFFQYTDGVTEATNSSNMLFGMERLEETLRNLSGQKVTGILDGVKREVDAFVGDAEPFDDLTMLCIEYHG